MMVAGPRVTSAMARDGFLPRALTGDDIRPTAAVVLQGALAIAMLLTSSFEALMAGIGVACTASSALCALALLRVARERPRDVAPVARVTAVVFLVASSAEVLIALWLVPRALLWLAGLGVLTIVGYRRAAGVTPRQARPG
jgi:amino acid transporter